MTSYPKLYNNTEKHRSVWWDGTSFKKCRTSYSQTLTHLSQPPCQSPPTPIPTPSPMVPPPHTTSQIHTRKNIYICTMTAVHKSHNSKQRRLPDTKSILLTNWVITWSNAVRNHVMIPNVTQDEHFLAAKIHHPKKNSH